MQSKVCMRPGDIHPSGMPLQNYNDNDNDNDKVQISLRRYGFGIVRPTKFKRDICERVVRPRLSKV